MPLRYYITPIEQITPAQGDWFISISRPAYISAAGGRVIGTMPYGGESNMLVYADVTAGQHATIVANADVIAPPVNIDNNIGAGALTAVQDALESLNIPGQWVTTAFTYRQVLRIVGGLFQYAQRYHGMHGLKLFRGGVTLSTQFNQLPANERQRLIDTANDLNYDLSELSGTSTIRQILRNLGGQWGGRALNIGGVAL